MPAEENIMEKNLSEGLNHEPCKGADAPSLSCNALWNSVRRVRETSPLVHNITNFVVMNNTANAVLAVGASPIMSHAHSEVEAMTAICSSLVVNIGTLDEYWVESMILAAREAGRLGHPWVFDPVGAGATPYRDEVSARILALRPTVVRGNASEIMALARANTTATKGVDSTAASGEAVAAAQWLNREFGSVVCISGETDIIVSGSQIVYVHNGSTMMTRVTGLGCSASAVIGAFVATAADSLRAVAAATALFAICVEIVAENSSGPGTLQLSLLDKLYNITEAEFAARLKIETR
jgi:hydroxyethylthiazole kinase